MMISKPPRGNQRARRALLEALECRTLLSALDISAGVLTYSVSGGASSLTVSVPSSGSSDISFTEADQTITLTSGAMSAGWSGSGTNTVTGPASSDSFMSILTNASAGQSLTIDYTNGDPLPASGVLYEPAAASSPDVNSLTLEGGLFTNETYSPTGSGAGVIVYSDSANSGVAIDFSNLSPVTDTVASPTFIFNAPSSATTVNLVEGPNDSGTQTDELNDGGTGNFELIDFGNKSAVTANVNVSAATTTIDLPTAASGLATLSVNSGAGGDAVDVQATPSGVATTVDTGSPSGSSINIGSSGSLAGINGDVDAQSTGGTNTLAIDDLDATAGATYQIADSQVTASSLPALVDFSGGGIRTLNLMLSGNGGSVDLATLAQSGVSTYHFSSAGGSGSNSLTIDSQSSTLNDSTAGTLGFGSGNPTVTYSDFKTISITKPAAAPVGTAATVDGTEGLQLTATTVATFTASDPGTTSDFTASITWGDGTTSAGTVISTGANAYAVLGTHTYAFANDYTIDVTLTDFGGTGMNIVSGTTLTINSTGPVNTSPEPIVSSADIAAGTLAVSVTNVTGTEGLPVSSGPIATLTDYGGPDPTSDYSGTITFLNMQGGTVSQIQATSFTEIGSTDQFTIDAPTFTLAEEGTYQVNVSVTDSGATPPQSAAGTGMATISDAPLTAGSSVDLTGNTGIAQSDVEVGSFSDADPSSPLSDFTANINWGDGTLVAATISQPGGTGTAYIVSGSHTYLSPGVFTTSVNVMDVGGSTVALGGQDTVTDLPVSGSVSNFIAVATAAGTMTLATITDPNPFAAASSLTAVVPIDGWGDGTPSAPQTLTITATGSTSTSTLFQVSGGHTYASNGSFPVDITVTTSGGVSTTLTAGSASVTTGTLAFTTAPVNLTAGASNMTEIVVLQNAQGATDTSYSGPVTLGAKVVPTGVSFTPITVDAVNGTATFTNIPAFDTAGGYKFKATLTGVTPGKSSKFFALPGAATQLAFSDQPTDVDTGQPEGTITVDVEDQFGNIVTSDDSTLITLGTKVVPPGVFFSPISADDVDGVATFTDVTFDTVGGYKLKATHAGLMPGKSDKFFVLA